MDWYVDNLTGDDGDDGQTEANAKATLDAVFDDADFSTANEPHNVYIKATGTAYTGYSNIKTGIDNIVIDRYPTDTGTSRPILYRGTGTTDSRVLQTDSNEGVTIKNMHFRGKGTDDADPQTYGLIFLYGSGSTDLTIEDCIIEQRFSHHAIRLDGSMAGTLTVQRCHIWQHDNYKDDDTRWIIYQDTSANMPNLTFEDNVCENYVQGIRAYYRTTDSVISIDHNTFVECGRSGTGKIVVLSGDTQNGWGESFLFKNNIITNSDGAGGARGVSDLNDGHTFDVDYNSWYNIADHYFGDEPTATNDMDVEPDWTGCNFKEWTAAHILMTTYYTPSSWSPTLIVGDSTGGTVGAIQTDLIGDESVIYDNRTTKAEADLEYYIVNSAFEDKMFSFSHGRGAQGSRFMYELEVTASRTRPTELRALAIDWFVKRKLKRRYGG